MEIIAIIKIILLIASVITFILSVIFLMFPATYVRIEELLNLDLIHRVEFLTTLEGKINVVNDWMMQNRIIFGLLFVLLSLYNIKSLILL